MVAARFTPEEEQKVVEAYRSGKGIQKIATEIGRPYYYVRNFLHSSGIIVRKQGFRPHLYSVDDEFFNKIDTQEKAYILGLLYADGHVLAKRNRFMINMIDKELIEDLKQHLKFTGPVRGIPTKTKTQWCIQIVSEQMVRDLIRLGCVPNKTKVLRFPTDDQVPPELLRHFIRGYFDGDGHLTWIRRTRTKRLAIGFVGTEHMVTGIKEWCGGGTISKSPGFCRLLINKISILERTLDSLYADATIYLERKKLKYDEYVTFHARPAAA